MPQLQILEGTPEQLTLHLSALPQGARYRITIQPEDVEGDFLTDEEIANADAALERTVISLGGATGANNECIDADLARA